MREQRRISSAPKPETSSLDRLRTQLKQYKEKITKNIFVMNAHSFWDGFFPAAKNLLLVIEQEGRTRARMQPRGYFVSMAPIALIVGYFLYQPLLRKTGIILSVCLSIVGCIAYALFQDVLIYPQIY